MFFNRRNRNAESEDDYSSDVRDGIAELGWTAFRTSKDPNKQIVLDYMRQLGIELAKSRSGLYYVTHINCSDFKGFQALTNYRAKVCRPGIVGVEMDDGEVAPYFTSLEDAYNGLKLLYDVARKTKGDDEF